MESKSKLIVFEGLDASFKETNSKRLYNLLKSKGKDAYLFTFPDYSSPSSFFVKEYLKGTYSMDPENVNYTLGSIFYMADQYHIWKTQIEPIYNRGNAIIILDRFWTSNLYHQLAKVYDPEVQWDNMNNKINELINLATKTFKMPYPDHILFMRMHLGNIVDFLKARATNDIHEGKIEYLRNVLKFYNKLELKNSSPVWCSEGWVNVMQKGTVLSREVIFEKVLSNLGDIIK